jgi:hypothetical protein
VNPRTEPDLLIAAKSSTFADEEQVLQSSKLIENVAVPAFAAMPEWDLNALPRNANTQPQGHIIRFKAANSRWNLWSREVAFSMLNPSHPQLRAGGLFLPNTPNAVSTVKRAINVYRGLSSYALENDLAADLGHWTQRDLDRYRKQLKGPRDIAAQIQALRYLFKYRKVLTGGGLSFEPWEGRSVDDVVKSAKRQKVSTKPIPPEVWWPLLRAAWAYIDVFSHDLIRARDEWEALNNPPKGKRGENYDSLLKSWLAQPSNNIPVHTEDQHASASHRSEGGKDTIHWGILSRLVSNGRSSMLFAGNPKTSNPRRAQVMRVFMQQRIVPVNLVSNAASVVRADGETAPWISEVSAVQLRNELVQLRTACYIFVAALSLLRDSELQGIMRDSIVQHFGAPAIRTRKFKKDRHHSEHNWWIIQPVAQAIAVAESLSQHPERVFSSSRATDPQTVTIAICHDIKAFIRRVNDTAFERGLKLIPEARITPQMFRKSMAVIIRAQPDGEIALGFTLKHAAIRGLSNSTTVGYGTPDEKWAQELRNELEDEVAAKLIPLWTRYRNGEPVASGVGAKQFVDKLESVNRRYEESLELRATIGDSRTIRNLLRDEFSTIHLGPLNHCLGILKDAMCTKAGGQDGPVDVIRPNRCHPDICRNSVVTAEHKPLWIASAHDLFSNLKDRQMAPNHRQQLESELAVIQSVVQGKEYGGNV